MGKANGFSVMKKKGRKAILKPLSAASRELSVSPRMMTYRLKRLGIDG